MPPTPTIRIEVPKPLWRRLLERALLGGGILLLCGLSFRSGQHYPLTPVTPAAAVVTTPAAPLPDDKAGPEAAAVPATQPQAQERTAPAAPAQDGLEVKAASLARDPNDETRLRYRLNLSNAGRKFNGTLQFSLRGEREGQTELWRYPAANSAPDPKLKVEVSRALKTTGVIPLPSGFSPREATVELVEPAGVRVSKQIKMGGAS